MTVLGVWAGFCPAALCPPVPYLVGAETGGPAPEISSGHGDAELQDGEDEQHDRNPVPCELQDRESPISSTHEEKNLGSAP